MNYLDIDPDNDASVDAELFESFVENRTITGNQINSSTVDTLSQLFPILPPSDVSSNSFFDRLSRFTKAYMFVSPQRLYINNAPSSQDIFVYLFNQTVPGLPTVAGGIYSYYQ